MTMRETRGFVGPKRRYEQFQFWMQDPTGDWMSLPLSEVAPSDLEMAKKGKTVWEWDDSYLGLRAAMLGVGVFRK